tara:strand:+ start:864 stop:1109 length:246 start_codon:yes stop_codon:yes gene_type:complete
MKCSIIKKRDGQMYEVAFDGFDTISEARVKLSNIANDLDEGEWWNYSNDKIVYDVYTYKIVKTSSISQDHSYGANDYITIK